MTGGANGAAAADGQPPAAPAGEAPAPKKRSRWGSRTEPADAAAAAAPGGDEGGEAKRQRKSKVGSCGRAGARLPPGSLCVCVRTRACVAVRAPWRRPARPRRAGPPALRAADADSDSPGCAQWDAAALAQTAVEVANQNDASRVSKDAIAKAQRMAAIQAQIQQQMQNLQAVPGAGMGLGALGGAVMGIPGIAAPGLPTKKETFMPAPLILDDKGRHVDSSGKEVVQKAEAVATLKANQVREIT